MAGQARISMNRSHDIVQLRALSNHKESRSETKKPMALRNLGHLHSISSFPKQLQDKGSISNNCHDGQNCAVQLTCCYLLCTIITCSETVFTTAIRSSSALLHMVLRRTEGQSQQGSRVGAAGHTL